MIRRAFLKSGLFLTANLLAKAQPLFALSGEHPSSDTLAWHERNQALMGTYVSLAIAHPNRQAALEIIGDCFDFIRGKIALISNWDANSPVAALNRGEALEQTSISMELEYLIATSNHIKSLTAGKFNLLAGQLTHAWQEAQATSTRLDRTDRKYLLRSLKSSRLTQQDKGVSISSGGQIDVGGIGKGLIADLARGYFKSRGIIYARAACSGDIRFLGPGRWALEIEHPRQEAILTTINMEEDWGVASSGDYRNYWLVNGERYHHLIDLQSGLPGHVAQHTTVIAPNATWADALASAVFFMSTTQIDQLTKKLPQISVLQVDQAEQLHTWGPIFRA